jgi:hypothetical protein
MGVNQRGGTDFRRNRIEIRRRKSVPAFVPIFSSRLKPCLRGFFVGFAKVMIRMPDGVWRVERPFPKQRKIKLKKHPPTVPLPVLKELALKND